MFQKEQEPQNNVALSLRILYKIREIRVGGTNKSKM